MHAERFQKVAAGAYRVSVSRPTRPRSARAGRAVLLRLRPPRFDRARSTPAALAANSGAGASGRAANPRGSCGAA